MEGHCPRRTFWFMKGAVLQEAFGHCRLFNGAHCVPDVDIAPFVFVPRDPHAAQGCFLIGENGCCDPVDGGDKLASGQEVAAFLDPAYGLRKTLHVPPSPTFSISVLLRG
jgi:hypothetical protein